MSLETLLTPYLHLTIYVKATYVAVQSVLVLLQNGLTPLSVFIIRQSDRVHHITAPSDFRITELGMVNDPS